MSDVEIKRIEEVRLTQRWWVLPRPREPGRDVVREQVENFPPHSRALPRARPRGRRAGGGHTALSGSATLHADGEDYHVEPGVPRASAPASRARSRPATSRFSGPRSAGRPARPTRRRCSPRRARRSGLIAAEAVVGGRRARRDLGANVGGHGPTNACTDGRPRQPAAPRRHDVRRLGRATTTVRADRPPRARRGDQLHRHRRRLRARRVGGDRRKALAGGRRDNVVLATRFHGTMGDDPTRRATRGAGSSARSRRRSSACRPTGSTSTRCTAGIRGPTTRRRSAR